MLKGASIPLYIYQVNQGKCLLSRAPAYCTFQGSRDNRANVPDSICFIHCLYIPCPCEWNAFTFCVLSYGSLVTNLPIAIS